MKLAIASGKGGTGKTAIATNLAMALAWSGRQVQLVDCDVEEPNAHLFLNPMGVSSRIVESLVPQIRVDQCNLCGECVEVCAYSALALAGDQLLFFPEMCHGCGGCARYCPEKAIEEVTRPIGTVLEAGAGKLQVAWGRADIGLPLVPAVIAEVKKAARSEATVIIDAPPGTSCAAVAAVTGCDLCLLVTEPTAFGLHDLALAVQMTRELHLLAAVIINRADLGDERVHIYCQDRSLPVLLEIPFSRELAACYARGQLWVREFPQWRVAFTDLWKQIEEYAHERTTSH